MADSSSATPLTCTLNPYKDNVVRSPGVLEIRNQVQPPSISSTPPAAVYPSTPINTTEAHPMRHSFGDLPEPPTVDSSPESVAPGTAPTAPPGHVSFPIS